MSEKIDVGPGARLEVEGAVAVLTVDSPPLNILSDSVRRSLYRAFETIRCTAGVRVLTVTGAGERAFSVGSDIREFPLDGGTHGGREKVLLEQRMYNVLAELPQVTIAQIQGYALGGGLELALACDLRVAAEDALLGFPEVKLCAFPCAGGTQRLTQLIGPAKAKELMFFGDPIGAPAAQAMGIINRVVPKGQLEGTVRAWANELASRPLPALLAIKRAVNESTERATARGQAVEAELFADLFRTEDLREGVTAYLEKRAPQWRHR